ncbi:hypothetical protein Q8A73_009530 [Channa argus]|nr:hypothetical protein Q8A73_009530 [Channa argus]
MFNVVSGYAPQVECELEEREKSWSELDEVMQSIHRGERVVIGADFNGHVGEGNRGDKTVMGRFGLQDRNAGGQMVVDFANRMEMAVLNTFFQKRQEHRVTYKSGGRNTQRIGAAGGPRGFTQVYAVTSGQRPEQVEAASGDPAPVCPALVLAPRSATARPAPARPAPARPAKVPVPRLADVHPVPVPTPT